MNSPAVSQQRPRTDVAVVQRRTVRVLFAAQVMAGLGMGAGMSIGSLLAYEVTSDEGLAGLSRLVSGLSVAVIASPLARLATQRGRRIALGSGWLVATLGALLLVAAVARHEIVLLMVGMFLFSAGSAAGLQARFAATDLAAAHHRARTLSLVVWATTVGSVLGPNLAGPGAILGGRLGLPGIAGAYLIAAAGTLLSALFVWLALRPDPLLLARGGSPAVRPRGLQLVRRAWHSDAMRLALVSAACAQFVMASVMVLTPVHMTMHGHALRGVGLIMSLHIAGMYAFSPVVGWLVDRLGERAVLWQGLSTLGVSLLVAWLADASMAWLAAALFLLGVGWSLASVAAAALVTRVASDDDRPAMQGAVDTVANLAAALAAALSGVVMGALGYRGLAVFAAVALAPMVVGLLTTRGRPPA
ncbi:MFS transporter [Luteococcus sp. OSA5]|uniref:MFS transporter n=1 Tax=Luteococcus sp. OSA5 TaxID=3401630 RepID=UPI003B429225